MAITIFTAIFIFPIMAITIQTGILYKYNYTDLFNGVYRFYYLDLITLTAITEIINGDYGLGKLEL